MSEVNAAFGLLQLKHIDQALARRKEIDTSYREQLADVKGIRCLGDAGEKVANYAYFPILVEPDYPLSRDALYQKLRDHNIFARTIFLSADLGFSDVPGLTVCTAEQSAGGGQRRQTRCCVCRCILL